MLMMYDYYSLYKALFLKIVPMFAGVEDKYLYVIMITNTVSMMFIITYVLYITLCSLYGNMAIQTGSSYIPEV